MSFLIIHIIFLVSKSLTFHFFRGNTHGGDKFRGVWDEVDGRVQIRYGEEVGLGTADYELIKLI